MEKPELPADITPFLVVTDLVTVSIRTANISTSLQSNHYGAQLASNSLTYGLGQFSPEHPLTDRQCRGPFSTAYEGNVPLTINVQALLY